MNEPVPTPGWADLVSDGPAIIAATRLAAAAYRALTGPLPADAACLHNRHHAPEAPLVGILTAWAGGVAAAVDVTRARRVFWIHWLGPAMFSEWFPDIRPPARHELARNADPIGTWSQTCPGPLAGSPITTLASPWPNDMTLVLLGHVGLTPTLAPWSAGGRITCQPSPFAAPMN